MVKIKWIDSKGDPVAGGSISLAGEKGSGGTARTDEEGWFEIPTVLPGPHKIYAGAQGHPMWMPRDIQIPVDTPYLVRLGEGGAVAGSVRDGAGDPVPGARLIGWDSEGGTHGAMTGTDGRFRVDGLPVSGTVTLTVVSDDPLYPDVTVACTSTEPIDFRPGQFVSIAGRVILPDGSPASRARLSLGPALDSNRPRQGREQHVRRNVTADSTGKFEVEGLVGERFTLEASRSDFLPSVPEEVAGGARTVVLRLREALAISGAVEFAGAPVADWGIQIQDAQGRTKGGEREGPFGFRIPGLAAGRYALVLTAGTWRRRIEGVEAGAEGVIVRVPDLEELSFAEFRADVPEEVHGAAWLSLWEAIDARDVRDEAGLIRAMPDVLLELAESRWTAGLPFLLLRRLGTPEAIGMMAHLLESPDLLPSERLPAVEAELLAVEHPGLGPAVIARFKAEQARGEESWVTLHPLSKLLARHGGEEGARIFVELFRRQPGYAVKGLAYATSPLILEAGLEYIKGASGSTDEAGTGLIEAFGSRAESALYSIFTDANQPILARRSAASALAAGCGPEFADRLLRIDPAEDAYTAVLVTTRLSARKNLPLEGARAEILREHARALIVHPDDSIRIAMLSQVRYGEVFRTMPFLETLEKRAEIEKSPGALNMLREAVTIIRADIERR